VRYCVDYVQAKVLCMQKSTHRYHPRTLPMPSLTFTRRVVCTALALLPGFAWAQSYPSNPTTLITNSAMEAASPCSVEKDFAPIAMISQGPLLGVTSKELSAKNITQLHALGRARPQTFSAGWPAKWHSGAVSSKHQA
jgi:hypothetical protein